MASDGYSGENDNKHSLVACARSNKEFKNFANIPMACTQGTINNVTHHPYGSTILKYLENELPN